MYNCWLDLRFSLIRTPSIIQQRKKCLRDGLGSEKEHIVRSALWLVFGWTLYFDQPTATTDLDSLLLNTPFLITFHNLPLKRRETCSSLNIKTTKSVFVYTFAQTLYFKCSNPSTSMDVALSHLSAGPALYTVLFCRAMSISQIPFSSHCDTEHHTHSYSSQTASIHYNGTYSLLAHFIDIACLY